MTTDKAVQALKQLAAADNRSDSARLRDIFDDVEAALASGYSREQVHQTLVESGFKFTLKTFDSALYRLRKQRKAGTIPAAKAAPAAEAAAVPAAEDSRSVHERLEEATNPDSRDKKFNTYFSQSNPLKGKRK